jgi:hypothetical protein
MYWYLPRRPQNTVRISATVRHSTKTANCMLYLPRRPQNTVRISATVRHNTKTANCPLPNLVRLKFEQDNEIFGVPCPLVLKRFFLNYFIQRCFICRPSCRSHCIGGCWDWTQDCGNVCIGTQKSDALTTWLYLTQRFCAFLPLFWCYGRLKSDILELSRY